MNNRRLSPSKKITLGAMVSALTLLCLYAVAVLPGGRAVFYFLSSVFVYALCCEGAYATALLSFAATAGLSFLLLPDKTVAVAYALLLGHYGIFKTGLDSHLSSKGLGLLAKLLYCNVFTAVGVYLAVVVMAQDILAALPSWLPLWGLIAGAQVFFILYYILYGLAQKIYETRLRSVLVPRR